jgi:hypothetical protein
MGDVAKLIRSNNEKALKGEPLPLPPAGNRRDRGGGEGGAGAESSAAEGAWHPGMAESLNPTHAGATGASGQSASGDYGGQGDPYSNRFFDIFSARLARNGLIAVASAIPVVRVAAIVATLLDGFARGGAEGLARSAAGLIPGVGDIAALADAYQRINAAARNGDVDGEAEGTRTL